MRKTITLILSLLLVISVSSISYATEEMKTNTSIEQKESSDPARLEEKSVEKKTRTRVRQVTGTLKSIDKQSKIITVTKIKKGEQIDTVLTITDKTKIMMDKENKTLSDLNIGDKVTVKFKEADGKNIAKSIAIKLSGTKTAVK